VLAEFFYNVTQESLQFDSPFDFYLLKF